MGRMLIEAVFWGMRKSIYGVHCVIQPKSFQGAVYSPNRFCKSDEKCSGLEYDLRSCFPLVLTSFLLESKLRQAALSPYGGTPPQLFCFDRSIQITNYIPCLIVVYTKLFFVLLLLSHLPQMPSFQGRFGLTKSFVELRRELKRGRSHRILSDFSSSATFIPRDLGCDFDIQPADTSTSRLLFQHVGTRV